MVIKVVKAAFIAAVFLLGGGTVSANTLSNYALPHNMQLDVSGQQLSSSQLKNLHEIIVETEQGLDSNSSQSLLSQLNHRTLTTVPRWFFEALTQCEQWHKKSEGRFTCRNGKLKAYWHNVVQANVEPERREARKLSRSARVANVTLVESTHTVNFDEQVVWDVSDIRTAITFQRAVQYLQAEGFINFHLQNQALHAYMGDESGWRHTMTSAGSAQQISLANTISYEFSPWQKTDFYPESDKKGVISHNDGWPTAMFATHVLADNAVDAAIVAYLGASTPSRELFTLLEPSRQHVQLTDNQQRLYRSDQYLQAIETEGNNNVNLNVDIRLPIFDVADYQGPYVTVWLTDSKSKLIKNLLIRGTGESWLKELRVWWRKVGRKNAMLVDGMSGATDGNKSIVLHWDGRDQFGQPVSDDDIILHVEAAREHGSRTYQKVPLTLSALAVMPVEVTESGELGTITISASK